MDRPRPPPQKNCTKTGPYTYRTYYRKADVAFSDDGSWVEFSANQKQEFQPDASQEGGWVGGWVEGRESVLCVYIYICVCVCLYICVCVCVFVCVCV
jgi:hypothetical protein